MQYQFECLSALKSVVNIQKSFEKTFMNAINLFTAIPDRIIFLQLGRYGCFSEQIYRNLFENETFVTPIYENDFHVIIRFRNYLVPKSLILG